MTIRPFDANQDDYTAVADIWNRTYPQYPETAKEIKNNDDERPDKIVWKRFVLELDGSPVGFGEFMNNETTFHPQEFSVLPVVVPEQQGKGYGKALYDHMVRVLETYGPVRFTSWSREDFGRKTRFLEDRGFKEKMRSFESRLRVATFDASRYEGLINSLNKEGLELTTFAELGHDTGRERKIYDLHTTLDLDVPLVGNYTKPSFERFAANHWESENFLPEGYLLAIHGDAYVGVCEVFKSQTDDNLHMGLTGVLKAYRRKGIALALKLESIAFARSFGAPEISTWNASNNRPMLAINEELGFVKEPAHISFVKDL